MDGLKPAYYTDPEELLGDFNNDGIIQSAALQGGGDFFSPYSADDTNGNGKWDPGETFRITTEMESLTGIVFGYKSK